MTSVPGLPWRKTSPSTEGIPLEDATADEPSDLEQVEYALVVGDDEAFDAMAASDLSEYFGRDRVFQLPAKDGRAADFYTRVTALFDGSATHDLLLAGIEAGAEITITKAATEEAEGIRMFVHTPDKDLRIIAAGDRPTLEPGRRVHPSGRCVSPG